VAYEAPFDKLNESIRLFAINNHIYLIDLASELIVKPAFFYDIIYYPDEGGCCLSKHHRQTFKSDDTITKSDRLT
jgi:hypothetical protein